MMDEAIISATLTIRVNQILAVYRRIDVEVMAGLPIHNPRLVVEAIGFRTWGAHGLGIVTTPWFMNLTLFAMDTTHLGLPANLQMPAGEVSLIEADLPTFGRVATCSLFSPMDAFEGMDAACETARHILAELFTPIEREPQVDRRALLRGRIAATDGP